MVSDILQTQIPPSPLIAIFGRPEESDTMTKIQMNVTAFTSLIACRRILLQWKSPPPLSFKSWISDIMSYLKLEKIQFSLRSHLINYFLIGNH